MKNKILELLYSWTVGLPEEVKIAEAYQMLKKQGEAPAPPLGSSSFRGFRPARSQSVLNFQRTNGQWDLGWLCQRPAWERKEGLSQFSLVWPQNSGTQTLSPCSLMHSSEEGPSSQARASMLAAPVPPQPPTVPGQGLLTAFLSTPGIVKADPKLPEDAIFPQPPPRPKNVIFEDEEKSKVRLRGGAGHPA